MKANEVEDFCGEEVRNLCGSWSHSMEFKAPSRIAELHALVPSIDDQVWERFLEFVGSYHDLARR